MITEGFELSDYACRSANSRGRAIEEKSSTSRTEFQRDRDPRMKERKKYGLKAARRAPQFSKR